MNIHSLRSTDGASARYAITFPAAGVTHIDYGWPEQIDAALQGQIIELMRHTTAGAPIIGFGTTISEAEAEAYLAELRDSLAGGKYRLLTIMASGGLLIGLCTLRRNLNPNNCHITDLAKGMIREEFRGGAVLPAAFHEIALKCEQDGVALLTLDVRADTPAHQAWKRFGFETYGVLDDYAREQGHVLAGHFMKQTVEDLKQRSLQALVARLAPAVAAPGGTA
jgi:hypothetical protein